LISDSKDPYQLLDFTKATGKIEVSHLSTHKKFRYFSAKGDSKKVDWRAKGLVRRKFETLERKRILGKGYKVADYVNTVQVMHGDIARLEAVSAEKLP
jgi:hypothetical protein